MSKFTEQQKNAIETIKENVVVSAGAGSGKTRVLVERFMYILGQRPVDKDGLPVDASRIMAITFTRKAAGEMKERIRKSMDERVHKAMKEGVYIEEDYWRKQLQLLERAQITTIHGLCSHILRDNPVEVQLDPGSLWQNSLREKSSTGNAYMIFCIRSFLRAI